MSPYQIKSLALQLPADQRAALAQRLITSLDEADEAELAWANEASRRANDLTSGKAILLSASDAFVDARRAIS